MAHNTLVRADAAAWLTVVYNTELFQLDTYCFESINGDQGGTWAPAAAIIIGGSGIQVTGAAILDDIQSSHVTSGNALTIDSGGFLNVASGGLISIQGNGGFTIGAGASGQVNGYLYVANAGYIEIQSGGVINVLSGANVNLQSGSQLRAYSGSYVQIDGDWEATATATVTLADGVTFTIEGSGNYPQLDSQSEWVPCGGYWFPAYDVQWQNYDGIGHETTVATAATSYWRVPVPEHYTISQVQVIWQGPAHGTWPPQNLTTFSVYVITVGGAKTLLATQADTNGQATYESVHALTISGFSQTFTPGTSLLIEMVSESGTNAQIGSQWNSAQMYATFSELRTAGA